MINNPSLQILSNYIKIFLPIFIFGLTSCDKDDDNVSLDERNEALFGQWEYVAIMSNAAIDINGDGIVNLDLYNSNEIRQCLKDDLTFFSSRGLGEKNAFSINENGLSCGDVSPFENIEDDEYELINNSILRFNNRTEMRIVEFTQNRLVLEQEDFLDNQNVIITYSYKRS